MLKGKENCQPRIPYPVKLLYKQWDKIKKLPDKQMLREFITSRSAYKKHGRESFLCAEMKAHKTVTQIHKEGIAVKVNAYVNRETV